MNLESQVESIKRIMDSKTKEHKVFLCPDDLFDHLVSLKNVGEHIVHVKTSIDEFYDKKRAILRCVVEQTNSGLYVFDSRKVIDKHQFIAISKSWYYYGERFRSRAHLALLTRDNEEYDFKEQLKFEFMCVHMENEYHLSNVLEELGMG